MNFDEQRLLVGRGPGLVGRWPGVILLVCGPDATSSVTDEIIASCTDASARSYEPGLELVRSIARMILQFENAATPAFALAARSATGLAVMAHGEASVTTSANTGSAEIAGWEAATWVDRIVAGDTRTILLAGRNPADIPESTQLNLQLGTVVGAAARLQPAGASPSASQPAVSPRTAGFGASPAVSHPSREPNPVVSEPTASPTAEPRGVLIVGGGTEYPLDQDLVIGRDPWDDEEVRAGKATAVVLDDPERSVSRVHAILRAVGEQVVLVDCGSTNGTSIAKAGASGWTSVTSHGSVVLESGTRVLLGQRTALFETKSDRKRSS
jgi:FHA domain